MSDNQERVEHFDVACEDCGNVVSNEYAEYTGDSEEAQWSCLVCQASLADLIELQRFREREPLVKAVLDTDSDWNTVRTSKAMQALRDARPCISSAAQDAAFAAPTSLDEHSAAAKSLKNPTR
jgi:phage major head subunit gpT-like protein